MARPAAVSLTNEELAKAALAVIDECGVDEFSFRKLSAACGVATMTIANRFGTREELLRAVLKTMLDEFPLEPAAENETWQAGLRRVAGHNREMALRHPKAFQLFVRTPAFEPPVYEYTQRVFATHAQQHLPQEMPLVFLSLMHSFLPGFQLAESYAQQAAEACEGEPSEAIAESLSLFNEETFERNLEIIIAGLAVTYDLPTEE